MALLAQTRHFFVPHSSNNHKARVLHPSILSVFIAFFLVYQFGINFFTLVSPRILGFASNITTDQLVEFTNQKRMENGVGALELNQALNEAALRKAGDMFAFDYWSHTSPSGRDPWDFFKEVDYAYIYAGENLARDFMNSSTVIEAWMESPTHRDNLLSGNYKEMGLAVVNGTLNGVETTLVVQLFGTPPPVKETVNLPIVGQAVATESTEEIIIEEDQIKEDAKKEAALGEALKTEENMVSPFSLTKVFAVALLTMILLALVVDVVLTGRRKIVRLSGKNLAHLIFIFILFLAAILTTQGAVL